MYIARDICIRPISAFNVFRENKTLVAVGSYNEGIILTVEKIRSGKTILNLERTMAKKYVRPHSLPYISLHYIAVFCTLYGRPDIARRNLSTLVSPIFLPQPEGVIFKHK